MSVLPFYPKYYGHTISREVEDIKIEPVAWNSEKIGTSHKCRWLY